MNYGQIVLADSKTNWISQCIKWFTKSQFSHSFVTIPDILGIPVCMEAEAGGIEVGRFDTNYLNDTDEGLEIWEINVSQEMKDKAIQQVLNDLEISYGFFQYSWFIWRRLNLLFGKDIKSKNNWFASDGLICSQFCVAYLKALGLEKVLSEYGQGAIAPQDLQDIFKAHPELFTLKQSVRMTA